MIRIIILLCALSLSASTLHAAPNDSHPRFAEGYILVKPKAGLSEEKLSAILARSNGAAMGIQRKLNKLGIKTVRVPRGREEEFAQSLGARSEFEFAEPDYLVPPDEIIPNDPKFGNQWHLQMISSPLAWEESTGADIIVAIIDTGVNGAHPDLAGRVLAGRNIVSNNSDSSDVMGHGTAVAGTVAAAGNNGIGIASVAYNARILPVRISNKSDGVAYHSDMAEGITWAADHGARVANLSYGVGGSATVQSAAKYMRNRGGLVFVSAGNASSDPGWSNLPDLLVVSATGNADVLTSFSNYGDFVDIAAPGSNIYTTTKSGGYGNWYGTSFSSPIAAGVAALIMSRRPELDPSQVFDIMAQTAVDRGDEGLDPEYGAGRVDAGQALLVAGSAPHQDTIDPTAMMLNPGPGDIVTGLVAVDVLAEDNQTVISVDLLIDNVPVATDFDPPYSFMWDSTTVSSGEHGIDARARDAAGNIGESSTVDVIVENGTGDSDGPVITISSPVDGATVSGNVQVSAFATDDGGVQQITISAGGKMLCAGAPSVSCGWNTRKLTAGNYSVTAKALDRSGNASSKSVSVTVAKSTKGGSGNGNGRGRGKKN